MIIKDKTNRKSTKDVRFIRGGDVVNYGNTTYNPIFRNFLENTALIDAYEQIPDLRTVINYYASQISKINYKVMRNTSRSGVKEDFSHPLNKLLSSPNYLFSYRELIKYYVSYIKLTGNGYLNAFTPVGFSEPSALYVFPSQYMTINTKNEKDFRTDNIVNYRLYCGQYDLNIPSEYILHKKEVNLSFDNEQVFLGQSPFLSSNKVLSSLEAIYESKVAIYQKRGALGILTFNPSGAVADFVAPRKEEIEKLQENYAQYGLNRNQYQVIISQSPLRWERMTMDIQELQLTENQKADREMICNALGIPAIIFTNEGTTFANKKEANIQLWEGELVPFAKDLYDDLTNYFRFLYKDDYIILSPDFSEIPELKEDEEKKHTRYMQDIEHGILTPAEVRRLKGYDDVNVAELDKFYISSSLNPINNINTAELDT